MSIRENISSRLQGKRLLLLFPHIVMKGGALLYTFKLAEILRDRGATVAILTLRHDVARYPAMDGVEIISLDGPVTSSLAYWLFLPLWQMRLHRQIAAWQADVIIPQVFPANWWGWLYKYFHRNSRIVWICQEPSAFIHSQHWLNALRPWWKRLIAHVLQPLLAMIDIYLCGFSDRIIANSNFTSEAVSSTYGRKADAVAYPAINAHSFNADGRKAAKDIITVARLTKFKRVDFLLRVFSLVVIKNPDIVYHVVGVGEELIALKELARNRGIAQNVIFHESVDDDQLAELYRNSAIFLFGSIGEPFGLAPIEAIACGAAVVAHDSGGLREFVTPACGRLVNSLDETCWSDAIDQLLLQIRTHPDYSLQINQEVSSFRWETTLEPVVRMVEEVMHR